VSLLDEITACLAVGKLKSRMFKATEAVWWQPCPWLDAQID